MNSIKNKRFINYIYLLIYNYFIKKNVAVKNSF